VVRLVVWLLFHQRHQAFGYLLPLRPSNAINDRFRRLLVGDGREVKDVRYLVLEQPLGLACEVIWAAGPTVSGGLGCSSPPRV
jgi:hypothetical protein